VLAESPRGSLLFFAAALNQTKMKYLYKLNSTILSIEILQKLLLFASVILVIISCKDDAQEDNVKIYYDLKGFMENQIVYLIEKQPEVSKTAVLDGQNETTKTRDINWKKELELFIQADINKPSYKQSYQVIRKDSSWYEYILKPSANLPVRYLKIVTDGKLNKPVYVKAIIRTENKIYKSEKNIELTCTMKDNLLALKSYSVQGNQKLVLLDEKSYHIKARIGL
jgi:hypothetical protein